MPAGAPRNTADYKTLYQLLSALSRASQLNDVFDAALTSLLEGTVATRAAILLFDDDGVIRFKAARGISAEYQSAVTGHSPWVRGTHDAHPLVSPDVMADPDLRPFRDALQKEGIRALAFIPLALDAGVIGKFMLYYDGPHEFAPSEIELAEVIAAHVSLATERKRAELARDRSERRFDAILDKSPSVIFIKDLQGRYLLVNQGFEELFHLPKANVVGRTDLDLFAPEMAEQFRKNDRAVVAAAGPLTIEEHVPRTDGIHTYISMKFPLQEAGGAIAGVCGIATDVTEYRQLEAASRHLAAIVESSDDAIIGKNLDGIVTSWNNGAERILGYSAAEIIGKPVSTLAAPGHLDEMPEILSKIRRGQRVEHFETRRKTKYGKIIDVELTVSPVRDRAGKIVGASKIARDITERKQKEQERVALLARENEARRTAELLNLVGPRLAAQLDVEKLVQEVADIATALVDAEFGSFFRNVVNEKGESQMTETLSGDPRERFERFSENAALFARTFRGNGAVRYDDLPGNSGGAVWADTKAMRSYLAVPVTSRTGQVLGGLFFGHSEPAQFSMAHETIVAGIAAQAAIALDNAGLLEQDQWAQAELERSNVELRRANSDLELFAYSASHDLQEPLRTIAISAQLIERNRVIDPQSENAQFLANILAGAKRMGGLIQDLLAYTKATKQEEGQAPCVDAGRVLTDVLENLRRPIEAAGATVTAGDLPPVAIHESRLAQLFQNLVGNAIKYTKKEDPLIHVTADERDGWCVFSVADNGIGIEPQFAEQIFGLFKRLHGRDDYPGSGIGLAICQRVVEQYGGRIWLERSAPGSGSTFCFALPSQA